MKVSTLFTGKMINATLLTSLALLGGCGIYESKVKPRPNNEINSLQNQNSRVSFLQVNEAIIQPNCTECHRAGRAKGGVQLDSYANVIANLAGVKSEAVELGEMPPTGPLPADQRGILKKWIEDGAPNTVDPSATPAPAETPMPSPTPVIVMTPFPPVVITTPTPAVEPSVSPTATPSASATPVPTATPALLMATYQSVHDQVFVAKCLKCHVPGGKASDFPLDNYDKMIAQGEMIKPFNSSQSTVVTEIESGSMPPRRSGIPAVTVEELTAIKIWITNGAKP